MAGLEAEAEMCRAIILVILFTYIVTIFSLGGEEDEEVDKSPVTETESKTSKELPLQHTHHKDLDDEICNKCHGDGKIECDCLKLIKTGSSSHFSKSKNGHCIIEIDSVGVINESIKRDISLELSVSLEHNEKLKPDQRLSVKRRIDGISCGMGSTAIQKEKLKDFRVDFDDCSSIESILGKELRLNDFKIRINLIDIKPIPRCNECGGTGYIQCPKCEEKN